MFRNLRRVAGITRDVAGVIGREFVRAVTTALFGDADPHCRVKQPPFFLNGTFVALLIIPVVVGKVLAGGYTLSWIVWYVAIPFTGVTLIVLPLVTRLFWPPVCAHCDYTGCTACSAALGIKPTRVGRHLDPKLITAGWHVVGAGTITYCPSHAGYGRAKDTYRERMSQAPVEQVIEPSGTVAVGLRVPRQRPPDPNG